MKHIHRHHTHKKKERNKAEYDQNGGEDNWTMQTRKGIN